MDGSNGDRLDGETLSGYFSGPEAPARATADALYRAEAAEVVVLVEGISDQIALETLARRLGRDLKTERVVVVPMGGAHEISRHLERFGPRGRALRIAGLCDAAEEPLFRRSIAAAGIGAPHDRAGLEDLGFFVCVEDLESELIRASGREAILSALHTQRDHSSFQTLQRQPAWRGRAFDDQFHRWLRAGARRSLRYAHLLSHTIEFDAIPLPLLGVLRASHVAPDA